MICRLLSTGSGPSGAEDDRDEIHSIAAKPILRSRECTPSCAQSGVGGIFMHPVPVETGDRRLFLRLPVLYCARRAFHVAVDILRFADPASRHTGPWDPKLR